MIELFMIYKWGFVLVFLASIVLTIQGSHLVARKESLQILALAQAALFGNIVGHLVMTDDHQTMIPLGFSFLALFTIKLSLLKQKKKKEAFYIVVYLTLMAFGHLLITAFPKLDSHMAVGLFGDIVSLSINKTFSLLAIFIVLLALQVFHFKQNIKHTIDLAILKKNKFYIQEELFFAIGLIISLFGLGLLFTVCFMIIPVVILGEHFKSYKQSVIILSVLSSLSAVLGLSLSIVFERVSTVPAQVLCLVFLLSAVKFVKVKTASK